MLDDAACRRTVRHLLLPRSPRGQRDCIRRRRLDGAAFCLWSIGGVRSTLRKEFRLGSADASYYWRAAMRSADREIRGGARKQVPTCR